MSSLQFSRYFFSSAMNRPRICPVNDAVIEAQGQTDDVADGNRIGPVLICNHHWFFKQPAHSQDGRLRLVDHRGAEIARRKSLDW